LAVIGRFTNLVLIKYSTIIDQSRYWPEDIRYKQVPEFLEERNLLSTTFCSDFAKNEILKLQLPCYWMKFKRT